MPLLIQHSLLREISASIVRNLLSSTTMSSHQRSSFSLSQRDWKQERIRGLWTACQSWCEKLIKQEGTNLSPAFHLKCGRKLLYYLFFLMWMFLYLGSIDGGICAKIWTLNFLLIWSLWCLTNFQGSITHIFILRFQNCYYYSIRVCK